MVVELSMCKLQISIVLQIATCTHFLLYTVFVFSFVCLAGETDKAEKSGAYTAPPSSYFVGSPMSAFPKKRSQKVRVITDLSSAGLQEAASINTYLENTHITIYQI